MVYWSQIEASPAALGGRMERYAARRVTRTELRGALTEAGLPMAMASPIAAIVAMIVISMVQTLVKAYFDEQKRLWENEIYKRQQKMRSNELRQTYRGIIPE